MEKIKLISYFEIALLIVATFSFSWSFGTYENKDYEKDIIDKIINFLDIIPSVSAQLNSNEIKLGCCFDSDEGLCDPNSLKISCDERLNGNWIEDKPLCEESNVAQCNLGCCSLGLERDFVTQRRCEKLSEIGGVVGMWDGNVVDEASCASGSGGEKEGACVIKKEF